MNMESVTQKVQRTLDSELRPLLQFHGGDVRVTKVTHEGHVHLEYLGACHGCNLQMVTHFITIRNCLLAIEGVLEVVTPSVNLSESAITRIEEAYRGEHPLLAHRPPYK